MRYTKTASGYLSSVDVLVTDIMNSVAPGSLLVQVQTAVFNTSSYGNQVLVTVLIQAPDELESPLETPAGD